MCLERSNLATQLFVEGATPASQVVTVGDGTDVLLQLRAPAPASGRLIDGDGQALPDVSVCCLRRVQLRRQLSPRRGVVGAGDVAGRGDRVVRGAGPEVFTDDAGRFSVRQLPGAPLDLTILLAGDTSGISIPINDVTAGGKATSVTVAIQPASASAPAPSSHPPRRARATVAVAPENPIAPIAGL